MQEFVHHHEPEAKDAITRRIEGVVAQWRWIVGTVAVLLVAAGIYSYAMHRQRVSERAAWRALAAAETKESPATAINKVVEEHAGTSAAAYAVIEQVQIHFDRGEYAKARLSAKSYLEQYADHSFAPQVRLEYARLLEWDGKWAAALEEYQAVLKAPEAEDAAAYLLPEAQYGRARCLEQLNRTDEAREAYRQLRARAEERFYPQRIRQMVAIRLVALDDPGVIPEPAKEKDETTPAAERSDEEDARVEE